MSRFPLDARLKVCPLAQRREGENVTIGDLSRQVFLSIPADGMDILNPLAAGKTVREAVQLYEQTHGEVPDVEDFLAALADEGFVAPWSDDAFADTPAPAPRASMSWLSTSVARRLLGPQVLGACALLIGAGLVLVAGDPSLVPGPGVLVFRHDLAALGASMVAVTLLGVMLHEIAHLVAARAAGVPARIGLGHRLWIVVAETDMTGIWMASKRRRYLAFLAGPIVDAATAAVLLGVLWADQRGWIGLSPFLLQATGATLLGYLLRILWQCFVFVRTDFYYVLATAFDCSRLLDDTTDLLRNRMARLRGSAPVVDQSAIPPAELRAVRAFAVVWLVGRGLAFASLILITLPVLYGYATEIVLGLTGGRSSFDAFDLVLLAAVGLGTQGAGVIVWIRSLHQGRIQRRVDALARS
jgi:putative peptide zinc metalloprotease protein